jgi:hypothetical protein
MKKKRKNRKVEKKTKKEEGKVSKNQKKKTKGGCFVCGGTVIPPHHLDSVTRCMPVLCRGLIK